MDFESLDRYLLGETSDKAAVVRELLSRGAPSPAAQPFYEGMRVLGGRTPDLTLIALRLVFAGKRADDAGVVELREIAGRARGGDEVARREYRARLTGE